jgi:intracellular sulfur oxidation DsrE/DsrF family protein
MLDRLRPGAFAMRRTWVVVVAVALFPCAVSAAAKWPAPVSPVVPGASGFVIIPNAAVPPTATHEYRAVWNATRAAAKPGELIPALDMAGSELNALGAMRIPATHAKFVVVFHDAAMDALLDDAHYRRKYGVANPNLPVIRDMKRAGTRFYVCGQNVAFAGIDPATLTKDVAIASDALIVLMTYQNDGYALLEY